MTSEVGTPHASAGSSDRFRAIASTRPKSTRSCLTDPLASLARREAEIGTRYIGSKMRVATAIADRVGTPDDDQRWFVDAFCGTGAVSVAVAARGWNVRVNDHLLAAVALAVANVTTRHQVKFAA